ncbi:MAG: hypothetical protein GOV15_00375, partial [Candidatus Diapherotrites archaeon]|nr:hypothetical protein [Candidatus Diapherotrites archaeon]
ITADLSDQLAQHSKEKNLAQLRQKTTEILRRIDPSLAESYEALSNLKVRRSDQLLEGFDKAKVVESLLKETKLPRGLAEKIAKEVEIELKKMNAKMTTALLIRELVNAKLVQYGFEAAQAEYTRVGLSVYDVNQLIQEETSSVTINKTITNTVLSQYTLLKALPHKISDAHMSGKINITGINNFPTKIISYTLNHAKDTDLEDVWLASSISQKQPVLNNANDWFSTATMPKLIQLLSQKRRFTICDDAKQIMENKKILKQLPHLKLKIGVKRSSQVKAIEKLLFENNISQAYLINENHKLLPQPGNNFISKDLQRGGVLEDITINLPALAQDSRNSQTRLIQKINDSLELSQRCFTIKKSILEKQLSEKLDFNSLYPVVSLFNLEGAIKQITEETIYNNTSSLKLAETILKDITGVLGEDTLLSLT